MDEIRKEMLRVRVEHGFQRAIGRQAISADLAMLWIKSLLIVNGGAIVGLATIGAPERYTVQMTAFRWSLWCLAASVGLTLLALLIGYVGQAKAEGDEWKGAHYDADSVGLGVPLKAYDDDSLKSWFAGIALAAAALACLGFGLYYAVLAIT